MSVDSRQNYRKPQRQVAMPQIGKMNPTTLNVKLGPKLLRVDEIKKPKSRHPADTFPS